MNALFAIVTLSTLAATASAQNLFVPGGSVGSSSTGNVGIGTSAPSDLLEIVSSAGVSARIRLTQAATGTWTLSEPGGTNALAFSQGGGSGLEYVRILGGGGQAGFVGIGTANPLARLHVAGPAIIGAPQTSGLYNGNANILVTSNSATTNLLLETAGIMTSGLAQDANGVYLGAQTGGNVYLTYGTSHTANFAGGGSTALFVDGRNGNVGIGTTNPTQKLSVNGVVRAKEVVVETTGWSDYVFASGYRLTPLSEVEQHIKAEKRLPGIPSAQEVAEHGVSMGDMQARLLGKIEELTLHIIAQERRADLQQQTIDALVKRNTEMAEQMNAITSGTQK